MTAATDTFGPDNARKAARRERLFQRINRAGTWLNALGLGFVTPLLKIAAGDNVSEQLGELRRVLIVPLIGIVAFVALWAALAPQVQTSLGAIPGPMAVAGQGVALWHDHVAEREKAAAFYARQDERNARLVAAGKAGEIKDRTYTGKPTFIDQIYTSLLTVGLGFVIGTVIAIPLGIASGLSKSFSGAINPLIQIFKPV